MDKCLNCEKELSHVEGRKKKKFCSHNCRAKHWQKTHPKRKEKTFEEIEAALYGKYGKEEMEALSKEAIKELFEGGVLITKNENGKPRVVKTGSKEWFNVMFTEKEKEVHQAIVENMKEKPDNSAKIAELQEELSRIPDKTKGIGKKLAESITSRIFKLKYNQ